MQKGLVGFFVSFISSHVPDKSFANLLVKKMMRMKPVQAIIIKTMCKLEPIINEEIIHIQTNKSPKSSNSLGRTSKLINLSRDVKNLMNNFENIQGKISGMLNIVDSIDFTVDQAPAVIVKDQEPSELEIFLSAIVKKKRITNDEIDEIRDDVWSKHMDVEKMMKVEMEKYYINLNAIGSKCFYKIASVKQKAGLKIKSLEEELACTWLDFRIRLDRSQMLYEDFLSQQQESKILEDNIIHEDTEMPILDYNSAIQKVKNLFTVRRILEKRKAQDDKIVAGLNNKIEILTEKFKDVREMNGKFIENLASISFCLDLLVGKANFPGSVKEKIVKYIQKQKCQKLETLFKIEEIFESYSVETVSNKFNQLKEGIATVSHSIRDENIKIKLSKLIIESKLSEIDKAQTLKNIQIPKPSVLRKGKIQSKAVVRKESPKEKTRESALDEMKKAMRNIDDEIKRSDKIVNESIAESFLPIRYEEPLIYVKPASRRADRGGMQGILSINSENLSRSEVLSTQCEEIHREDKEIQVGTRGKDGEVQADFEIYKVLMGSLNKISKDKKKIEVSDLDQMLIQAVLNLASEKNDFSGQTDKEAGILDTSTPNNSIIRGLMSRVKTLKYDKSIVKKPKISTEPNVVDNLIIKKIFKPVKNDFKLFKTEIKEKKENKEEDEDPENSFKNQKALINTQPISKFEEKFKKADQSFDQSKAAEKKKSILESLRKSSKSTDPVTQANEEYRKEFELQMQINGLKKVNFEEIQSLWEEVINRRILEGETDKISIYLRGYLGTERFESEKQRVISMFESSKQIGKSNYLKLKPKLPKNNHFYRWENLMRKVFTRQALKFESLIDQSDSPSDIVFKAAKYLKFVMFRLDKKPFTKPEPIIPDYENRIVYRSEQWSLNSVSLTPVEGRKSSKKSRLLKKKHGTERFLRHKSPFPDKFQSDTSKLPYIKS